MIESLKKELNNLYKSRESLNQVIYNLEDKIYELEQEDLKSRNKNKFLRLTRDYTTSIMYFDHESNPVTYKKGTLIESEIKRNHATVFLDHDGDGILLFPADVLKTVEVDANLVDWDKVITQG